MSDNLLKELQRPFIPEDIEWRIQSWGKHQSGDYWAQVLAYVTNRAIQNRLDDVVGPMNWQNEFKDWHGDSQLCGISIRLEDPSDTLDAWVTKWDGAECTNIEAIKGGLSDAMKRAAVQWGIGRYLYKLESNFAQQISLDRQSREKGWRQSNAQDKTGRAGKKDEWHKFYWLPPDLPKWALPEGHPPPPKDTGFKKPQIPAKPTGDPKVEILQAALKICDNMGDLQRVWESSTIDIRNLIGADYIKDLQSGNSGACGRGIRDIFQR